MTDLLKQAQELVARASPLPWLAQQPTANAKMRLTLESMHDIATFETIAPHRSKVHLPLDDKANAQLTTVAVNVFPAILEALVKPSRCPHYLDVGETCMDNLPLKEHWCDRCAALDLVAKQMEEHGA